MRVAPILRINERRNAVKSQTLIDVAVKLIKIAAVSLPHDVKQALKQAYEKETSETGKTQLQAILKNIELAEKQKSPICQDTGTIHFYVKAGARAKNLDKVEPALINAVRKATKQLPLRPNAVDPFTQRNSGDNTGRYTPQIHWEIVPEDSLELTVMLKGGGSENVSVLGMLNPAEGLKGIKRFVVNAVVKAGAQPCPPTILGVAVGGSADLAITLAKKALLKPLNEANVNPQLAQLERELLEAVNMTGIGPMGLGGDTTALAVHVDYASRHPASFPVAVVFSCWCDRRASARVTSKGEVEYLQSRRKT
jgi:fumarate hydratase subunit alpha